MQTRAATSTMVYQHSGFTLVELVATIILLGILAVAVAPRFNGNGVFSEHALRDQLISSLRFAQQRAMYDHGPDSCYRFLVDTDQFGPQRSLDKGVTFVYFGPDSTDDGVASLQKIVPPLTVTALTVDFDGLGNALSSGSGPCGGTPANAQISIRNAVQLDLCVLSTGFVENFACP